MLQRVPDAFRPYPLVYLTFRTPSAVIKRIFSDGIMASKRP
jgi:hypothetical protein